VDAAVTPGPTDAGARSVSAYRPPGLVRKTLRTVIFVIALVLLALFVLGPIAWLAVRAFAGVWKYPDIVPTEWTLKWWHTVFSDPSLLSSMRLSVELALVVTFVSAIICLPAAYAFSRFKFPGRQVMLISLFAANAFPRIGLFVALAGLFYTLHLMETFVGLIIVQLLGTIIYMTWIPAAAFASVPRSLEEAARDAGARPLRVFFKVTVPLALPGILVAMILSFISAFDEAQGSYLVGAPTYLTMPTEMYTLVLNYPPPVAAVFSVVLSTPSVILMLLVRRHIMGGTLAEGFQLR
jgi:putative spermidine/putrescine transport system permease protein